MKKALKDFVFHNRFNYFEVAGVIILLDKLRDQPVAFLFSLLGLFVASTILSAYFDA